MPYSTVTESQPNAIVQYNPDIRRRQIEQLVHTSLNKTTQEPRMKEGLSSTMDIVLSAKNTISFAIQAVLQAALAWTGICIALEASSSTKSYFTHRLLEMLVNPIKETKTNRDGVIHIIEWMNWYWSLLSSPPKESTDNANKPSRVRPELENRIVGLYKVLLI
ncbi:MAG: hypothetical protein M1839_002033 [Geoglossum umbratile]|nr:MAG: hypothetical protein M1839_002033 [Geoglossum umbratile]